MKESFLLDTDAQTFGRWLEGYSARLRGTRIALDEGSLVLSRARVHSNWTRIDIPAVYVESAEDRPAPCSIDSVISFEVLPLSTSLIRVTCGYHREEVADAYGKILEVIARRWPDTSLARRLMRAKAHRKGRRSRSSVRLAWVEGAKAITVRTEKALNPETEERRRQVKRLWLANVKRREIAERLGWSESTIRDDLAELRRRGEL